MGSLLYSYQGMGKKQSKSETNMDVWKQKKALQVNRTKIKDERTNPARTHSETNKQKNHLRISKKLHLRKSEQERKTIDLFRTREVTEGTLELVVKTVMKELEIQREKTNHQTLKQILFLQRKKLLTFCLPRIQCPFEENRTLTCLRNHSSLRLA